VHSTISSFKTVEEEKVSSVKSQAPLAGVAINPEAVLQQQVLSKPITLDDDAPQNAVDCEIDDIDLLAGKKHLVIRGGPLNLIEALKGKHKELGFLELLEPGKDLKNNKAFFTSTWSLKGYPGI